MWLQVGWGLPLEEPPPRGDSGLRLRTGQHTQQPGGCRGEPHQSWERWLTPAGWVSQHSGHSKNSSSFGPPPSLSPFHPLLSELKESGTYGLWGSLRLTGNHTHSEVKCENIQVISPLQEERCHLSLAHPNHVLMAQRKESGLEAQWKAGPRLDPRHCPGNGSLSHVSLLHDGRMGLALGLGTQQVLNMKRAHSP